MPLTIPGPKELGYAEITSNFTSTSTSATDITGLTTTVTVGSRPIIVEIVLPYVEINADGASAIVYLEQGGTLYAYGWHQSQQAASGTDKEVSPMCIRRRFSVAAGSYTYKGQVIRSGGAGTPTVTIAAAADTPAWIRVEEVRT